MVSKKPVKTKKLSIYTFMMYLVLFALVFFLSLYDYIRQIPIINIGGPPLTINLFVLLLSFLGLVKTIWYMWKK